MLAPGSIEKEYEQIVRTPFDFFWQAKTCFMKALPYVASGFLLLPDPKAWEKEKRDGAKERAQKAL